MRQLLTAPKLDRLTWGFLGLVMILGMVYVSFDLTPSSYGEVLARIDAPEYGPALGYARFIRSDEWAITTPFFQATVRNGFRRVNETSFYKEDLRGQSINFALPLKDWALVFKPHLWAFFLTPPATAYSIFWAVLMCGCLAGYQLLFRQLGADPLLSAAVAVMILFCGYSQFWWTSFAPLIAGFPWILLILFSNLRWWHKALWFSWVLPAFGLADLYPGVIVELAFVSIVVVVAIRPAIFRTPRELAAVAIGCAVMLLVLSAYYSDVIPAMRNTEYPGHRVAPPGDTSVSAVLSQFFPYLSFTLHDYRQIEGPNICMIGAVGSFLPLLTLCLARYRAIWSDRFVRRALIVLLSAMALITVWQIAPAPLWLGRILLWDISPSVRSLLASGLLLTFAAVLIWTRKLVSLNPSRILVFVLIGPVASVLLKLWVYHVPIGLSIYDLFLCAFLAAAAIRTYSAAAPFRAVVILASIALVNVYAFGRFNPLQSAKPIFQIPDTNLVLQLRAAQDASPEHILVDVNLPGATLNGMGFRSVSHTLIVPMLDVFRNYFPTMDAQRFNQVFNRVNDIHTSDDKLPRTVFMDVSNVPRQAFEPVRHSRQLRIATASRIDCSTRPGGGVDHVSLQGDELTIEGWAPWNGEDQTQELEVLSTRPVGSASLLTVKRPDVAETLRDYGYDRSGFQLKLSSADGRPLQLGEIVLVARNTSQGPAQLSGCGCP